MCPRKHARNSGRTVNQNPTNQDVYRLPAESWRPGKVLFMGLAVVGLAASAVGFVVDRE